MFMNRHLNFGYLLVIVAVFVIAMSASCKIAYSKGEGEAVLVIALSVEDGSPRAFEGFIVNGELEIGPEVTMDKGSECEPSLPHGKITKIIPAMVVTHTGSPGCVTYWQNGEEKERCWPPQ